VYEILKDLKEKLNLEYIGIMGKDGFSVYEVKDGFENSEEKIAELSEILLSEIKFSRDTMKSDILSSFLRLENELNVYIFKLNDEYFLIAIFSSLTPFGKVNFYFSKEKEKIIRKL